MKLHLAEMSRRGVFKTLAAYGVTSWIAIEAASIIAPAFLLPDWTVAAVTTLVVLGAFPTVLFAWRYELTRKGIKRDTRHIPDNIDRGARRISLVLVLVLLGITAALWVNYFRTQEIDAVEAMTKAQLGAPQIEEDGRIRSIAVLPFDDFSPASSRRFLANGVAETILHELAQNPELIVTARKSSFYFRDKDVTAAEIGQILGVEALLEGSIQVVDDKIRITSQLVRTSDQSHLWSNVYEDSVDNVFYVQDTIARTVRDLVLVTKDPAVASTVEDQSYPSVEAFELLQEAKSALDDYSLESIEKAIRLLRVAVDLSPEYADAHATLAATLWKKNDFLTYSLSRTWYEQGDILKEMDAAIERALEINPDHALALLLQGARSQITGGAGYQLARERVEQLAPNDPDALLWLAMLSRHRLDYAKEQAFIVRARAVDPSNLDVFRMYIERQCRQQPVLTLVEKHLQTYPVSAMDSMDVRAQAYQCDGRYTEWIREKTKIYKTASGPTPAFWLMKSLAELGHAPALHLMNDIHLLFPNLFIGVSYDNTIFFDSIASERAKVYRWHAASSYAYWWFMPIRFGLLQIQLGDFEAAQYTLESVSKRWEQYYAFMERRPIQEELLTIYAYQSWLMAQRAQYEQSQSLAGELLNVIHHRQLGAFADTMGSLRDVPLLVLLLNGENSRAVQWLRDAEHYRWSDFQIVLSSPIYAEFRKQPEVQQVLSRLVLQREAALESMKELRIAEVLDPAILLEAMKAQIKQTDHHLAQIELHFHRDIQAAARLYEKALALEPDNFAVIRNAVRLASMLGRAGDAAEIWRRLQNASDRPDRVTFSMAQAFFYAGQWQDCIDTLEPLIESNPRYPGAHFWTGLAYVMQGRPDVGSEYFRQETDRSNRVAGFAVANHALGLGDEATETLVALNSVGYDHHYGLAYILAYLGEKDRAFEFLEKAYSYRYFNLAYIRVNPLFRNLHDDERWIPFLEKLGIAPVQVADVQFNPLN